MAFENNEIEPSVEEAGPPPSESGNRSFLIVAGILGALLVLSLICVAAYAFLILPMNRRAQATQNARVIAQNTAAALSARQTALALAWTATPTLVKATKTPVPTNTSVVVIASTSTTIPTADPRTATIAALLTQQAILQKTVVPTVTAVLPKGGFADQYGVPGLVGLAVILVAVIFLARRLRTAG